MRVIRGSTRTVVLAYQGDAKQVVEMLPLWEHHGNPVTILSPADSAVNIPWVECRNVGEVAHFGPKAQQRHLAQMKLLIDEYPDEYFFINESDSFCVSPRLPDYLYSKPSTFWTNGGRDESTLDGRLEARPRERWFSFQGPWWMPRTIIERMVAAAPLLTYDGRLKWVDLYLSELAFAANVPFRIMPQAICMPIAGSNYLDHELNPKVKGMYADGLRIAKEWVRRDGVNMIHSCKTLEAGNALVAEYTLFQAERAKFEADRGRA
jgi:hypothetical protein